MATLVILREDYIINQPPKLPETRGRVTRSAHRLKDSPVFYSSSVKASYIQEGVDNGKKYDLYVDQDCVEITKIQDRLKNFDEKKAIIKIFINDKASRIVICDGHHSLIAGLLSQTTQFTQISSGQYKTATQMATQLQYTFGDTVRKKR